METPYSYYRSRAKNRLLVVFLIAILLHVGLIGIAAIWPNWNKPEPEVTQLETDVQLGDTVQELIVPEDQPPPPEETPPEPTPIPEATPEETPPPPEKEPDFVEPTPAPTPQATPKTLPRNASTPPPANAKKGKVPQEGVVGGNANKAEKKTGTPGGKTVGAGWKTPKPIYPAQARQMHIQGSGSVRISTDSSGNVTSVEITGAINPILDSNTKSFARSNWHGPPNSSTTVPITYKLDQ